MPECLKTLWSRCEISLQNSVSDAIVLLLWTASSPDFYKSRNKDRSWCEFKLAFMYTLLCYFTVFSECHSTIIKKYLLWNRAVFMHTQRDCTSYTKRTNSCRLILSAPCKSCKLIWKKLKFLFSLLFWVYFILILKRGGGGAFQNLIKINTKQ